MLLLFLSSFIMTTAWRQSGCLTAQWQYPGNLETSSTICLISGENRFFLLFTCYLLLNRLQNGFMFVQVLPRCSRQCLLASESWIFNGTLSLSSLLWEIDQFFNDFDGVFWEQCMEVWEEPHRSSPDSCPERMLLRLQCLALTRVFLPCFSRNMCHRSS